MTNLQILEEPELNRILEGFRQTKVEKKKIAFNLFTVSSYNNQLENFHSDLIASLLNPNGLHQQGPILLQLFIKYLSETFQIEIHSDDFSNAKVLREKGRIDIWIRDERSKKCIIIENKINDAQDMDDQLNRYFHHAKNDGDDVVAAIYLSLLGTKKAPPVEDQWKDLVINIAAFSGDKTDLVSGWLLPSFNQTQNPQNPETSSFIYQYIKLLKHLGHTNMDKDLMQDFYTYYGTPEKLEAIDTITTMRNRLSSFRANSFMGKIKDYEPFTKSGYFKEYYLVFDAYKCAKNSLKLDVWFTKNGNAALVFWNTTISGLDGRTILAEKLESIGLLEEFENKPSHNDNGYKKEFILGTGFQTIQEVDKAVFEFVDQFFIKLRESQ